VSVLDQSYRRWRGKPTPYLERMLVIPRFDALEILSRKGWVASYVVALVPPLLLAGYIYFAATPAALWKLLPFLEKLHLQIPLPGAAAWRRSAFLQTWFIVGFAMLVGPPLATRDFANGALTLYLSKALRRFEYVLGRSAILLVLLSAASWIPLVLVFFLELALAPAEWRHQNAWMLGSVLLSTVPVVVLMTLLIEAVASFVHRANVARLTLLALVLVTWPLGEMMALGTGSPSARAVSPMAMAASVNDWAFDPPAGQATTPAPVSPFSPPPPQRSSNEMPVGTALGVMALWLAGCVGVLAWRVRPVEVVK
jgi:hypothetical protein